MSAAQAFRRVIHHIRRLPGRLRERFAHRRLADARRLEALGRLPEAIEAYVAAGAGADACRLWELRADATPDPVERLRLLGRAIDVAPGERQAALRRRYARLRFDLGQTRGHRLERSEWVDLGADLEQLGDFTTAARAYEMGGDAEGRTRALIAAGEPEVLEQVLDAEQLLIAGERRRTRLSNELSDLERLGLRRRAIALGRNADLGDDARLLVRRLEETRLLGPRVRLELDGIGREYVFGASVTIGRSGASLTVSSPNVSRVHLCLRTRPDGPEVVDLGSRNGTLLAGARLSRPLVLKSEVTLVLGGDVPVGLAPLPGGGVRVSIAGNCIVAPLGPVSIGSFWLNAADDGWMKLDTGGARAVLNGLLVAGCLQLCSGDEVGEERCGAVRLKVPK